MEDKKKKIFLSYFNSGSVLIISLWIIAFFAVLGVVLYKIASSRISLAQTLEKRLLSQYAAKAVCLYVKYKREKDKTSYDTLYELNSFQKKTLGDLEVTYKIVDEESKININTSSKDILSRVVGLDKDIADSIVSSSLRPFDVKEEILLVKGVTEEVFEECKDFITVYGEGKININTASGDVLKALGLDDDLTETIINFRAGADGEEATEDDGVFESVSGIINTLRTFTTLTVEEETTLIQIISKGLLDVKSENLALDLQTKIRGKPGVRYNIVLDDEKIKRWQEY